MQVASGRKGEWGRRLEGSRFGARPRNPAICSVKITAEKRAQQAAPAIDPALRGSTGPRRKRISEALGKASRWVISGSRLLSRFQARLAI